MTDYDVWHTYKGKDMIIGNVKAKTLRSATRIAERIYGSNVWVKEVLELCHGWL